MVFLLLQTQSQANQTQSSYSPKELYLQVVQTVFRQFNFPYTDKLLNDILAGAALDDNEVYYDADILRTKVVHVLKDDRQTRLVTLEVL